MLENAGDQVVIGLGFASDWLRGWHKFLDQSESKSKLIQCNPENCSNQAIQNQKTWP